MNVILIAIDTLRADHLSCYGYRRLTSPHIDRIAREGVLFSECFSAYIPTHPGFTTMFTGRDVFTHQVICQGSPKVELDPEIKTLAEILQEQGYLTASVDNLGRWFSRGFEIWEKYSWERDPTVPWRKAEAVNTAVLPTLEKVTTTGRPFFLFLHYWDPHTPYLPPPPFDHMFYSSGKEKDPSNHSMDPIWEDYEALKYYFAQWMGGVTDIEFPDAQYDAEIAYCDTALARIFTRLEELSLMKDTLLILTSDHGEELHEHEGCWYDHHGLYETNLRVPLIMRCPGRLPAGKRVKGFVRLEDLAPTVLDFLGLSHLAEAEQMEGASTLPLISRSTRSTKGLCSEMYLAESSWMRKRGWRTRDWKLIVSLEDPFHLAPIELYDMRNDPMETKNVADERPAVVEQLQKRMETWRAQRMKETGNPDPHSYQEITIRQIGKMETAVPEDQKLEEGKEM